jgi:hypothetical protein
MPAITLSTSELMGSLLMTMQHESHPTLPGVNVCFLYVSRIKAINAGKTPIKYD